MNIAHIQNFDAASRKYGFNANNSYVEVIERMCRYIRNAPYNNISWELCVEATYDIQQMIYLMASVENTVISNEGTFQELTTAYLSGDE
jgi:hypothetical protein